MVNSFLTHPDGFLLVAQLARTPPPKPTKEPLSTRQPLHYISHALLNLSSWVHLQMYPVLSDVVVEAAAPHNHLCYQRIWCRRPPLSPLIFEGFYIGTHTGLLRSLNSLSALLQTQSITERPIHLQAATALNASTAATVADREHAHSGVTSASSCKVKSFSTAPSPTAPSSTVHGPILHSPQPTAQSSTAQSHTDLPVTGRIGTPRHRPPRPQSL